MLAELSVLNVGGSGVVRRQVVTGIAESRVFIDQSACSECVRFDHVSARLCLDVALVCDNVDICADIFRVGAPNVFSKFTFPIAVFSAIVFAAFAQDAFFQACVSGGPRI